MFLSMYDHPQTTVFQLPVDTDQRNLKSYYGAYVPMESSVNCSLLFGDSFHSFVETDKVTASCFPQVDPVAMGSYHVQDNKFFEYNDAYSVEQTAKVYVPKYKYDITGKLSGNRIVTSQVKTNGEITDSWTTFLHANYLDVDTSYGQITNLKNFGNRLLFWQDDAFGVASVNDRSLITDSTGAQLVLGTGDVLARYDYMSTSNGNSTINDKSLIQTVGRLYWMDLNKNELCKYGDTIEPISKSKGFQTLLNDRKLNNSNKIKSALYNRKYNEVWFSFNDYSLIFSEQNDRYISRFSHTSDYPIMFSNELYSISNNKLYKLNEAMSTTNDQDYKSSITYVVNKDYGTPKVFDNVNFSGWFSNTFQSTITNIKFDTKHQTAQPLKPVIYPGQVAQYKYAIDYRENTYRYAIGRNEKINNNKDRMRGNDLTCTIEFDTKNNNEFKIPFINTNYRYTLL